MSDKVTRRKAHTKSRKGCFQCKQRHTKCNEAHPQCANCARLNIQCTWPTPNGFNSSPHPENHVSMMVEHRNFSSPDLQPAAVMPTIPVDDMRLLYHWTTKTSLFHSAQAPFRARMWREDVVEMAFDHPFLLHGILAVSAIHKCATETHQADRQSLLQQADSHMTRSLAPFRFNLEHPSEETALPMFIESSILVTYNLGSAQVGEPDNPIDALVHCFRLVQGVKLVIRPHWEKIRASNIFSGVASGAMNASPPPPSDGGHIEEISRLKGLTAHLPKDSQDKQVCDEAIDRLHDTFYKVHNCAEGYAEHSIMMIWPAVVESHYLSLLANFDRTAIIILLHFSVLLARNRDAWWIKGWADRILYVAERLLEPTPDFQHWLIWPKAEIQKSGAGTTPITPSVTYDQDAEMAQAVP